MKFRTRIIVAASLAALMAPAIAPSSASASDLVDRMTKKEVLKVDAKGTALVLYKKGRKSYHVLYWGPQTAVASNKSTLRFKLDRSGGWKSKRADWKKFKNVCGPYTGPALPYVVKACSAPDGSHWVLQKWARVTPNYGGNPEKYWKELRLSHFTIAPAELKVYPNWSWSGRFFHAAMTLTYNGAPWYALEFKPDGYVTDQIGRNITIDSYNSDMGSGWRRVNAILTHRPSGQACFGFTPKDNGKGGMSGSGLSADNKYRISVPGPGVSPDVNLYFDGLRVEDYDPAVDEVTNQFILNDLIGSFTGRHSCQKVN